MASFVESLEAFVGPAASGVPGHGTAGLFVAGDDKSVPLRIRSVKSTVHCDTAIADTAETFAFIADEDVSVVFKFPLPPRAAVYKLSATVGDRTVVTEVKAKQVAQREFDQAVSQGHTAVVAKQEDSTQIFTLELGNLRGMEEALVEVSYVRVLDAVGGAVEFVHTATWTPPYLGSAGDAARGPDAAAQGNPRFASRVAYSLAYDVLLMSTRGVASVESPEANLTVADEPGMPGAKRVTVSDSVGDPSKDLTLLVELAPEGAAALPGMVTCADGHASVSLQRVTRPGIAPGAPPETRTYALATFVPAVPPAPVLAPGTPPPLAPLLQELIMIIDCSGSMMGAPIEQAREAALYFIKDLPTGRGLRFNVVAFGSDHIMWSASGCQEVTAESMASAVAWVQEKIAADLGGTEILATMQAVYAVPTPPGYARHIIFLTDGGIPGGEEASVFSLVGGPPLGGRPGSAAPGARLVAGIQKLKDRVMGRPGAEEPAAPPAALPQPPLPSVLCLGIGHGVHRGLLEGCATRSGGLAVFVVEGEGIARKVGVLKKAALAGSGAVRGARLVAGGALVRTAPHVLPPRLFPGEPFHALVELEKTGTDGVDSVSLQLTGKRGDGMPFTVTLPLKGAPEVPGDAYAVLHAMCTASALAEGRRHLHCGPDGARLPGGQPSQDEVRAAIVQLAVREHLITKETAAVGVWLNKDPMNPAEVKKVFVPLATPHGADLFKDVDEAEPVGGAMMHCAMAATMYGATSQSRSMAAPSYCTMAVPMSAQTVELSAAMVPLSAEIVPLSAATSAPMPCQFNPFAKQAKTMAAPGGVCSAAPRRTNRYVLGGPPALPMACMAAPMPPPCQAPVMAMLMECARCLAVDEEADDRPVIARAEMDLEESVYEGKELFKEAQMEKGAVRARNQAPRRPSPQEVLALLNLQRGVDGFWADGGDDVLGALTTETAAARAAKPAALTNDQWLTVLALAFLNKHCNGERSTWEGMASKATTWLQGAWPTGERSVAMTVLMAQKLV